MPLVFQIKSDAVQGAQDLPLTENGALLMSGIALRALRRIPAGSLAAGAKNPTTAPVELVTPDSLDPDRMRVLWDRVLTEDRESEVVDAMRLLAGDLKSIRF